MFDIGFSELMVIGVVALVVLGPERLPKVARTVGHLMGRAQRYVNDVKADINREMELEELRKLQSEMQDAARSIETQVADVQSTVANTVHQVEHDLSESVNAFEGAVMDATAEPVAEPSSSATTESTAAAHADPAPVPLADLPPAAEHMAHASNPAHPVEQGQLSLLPENTPDAARPVAPTAKV